MTLKGVCQRRQVGSLTTCGQQRHRQHLGFKGGVFDGQYVYFVPYQGSGRVLRYNTQSSFTSGAS